MSERTLDFQLHHYAGFPAVTEICAEGHGYLIITHSLETEQVARRSFTGSAEHAEAIYHGRTGEYPLANWRQYGRCNAWSVDMEGVQ